jgi:[ribosomal protein S5]-alanine N-acetyltransferase
MLDAGEVLAAIIGLRGASDAEGFVICDAVTGERLGNIALSHDGRTGVVSYWVAATARGRGVAAHACTLFSSWSF